MMVADIRNCRVLVVDRLHRILHSYGSPSRCYHHPPDSFSSPNGATPLADGGILITEIGGWIDRLDRNGNLVYTVRTPTAYPSDAQLLPNGELLVAGFNTPGRVDILSRSGAIKWTYGPAVRPRLARSPFSRRPLAERNDRRHRRLAPPNRRDRSEDQADRLAIRALRHRLVCSRIPVQAGRARPTAGGRTRRDDPGCRRPPVARASGAVAVPGRHSCACESSATCRRRPPASRSSRYPTGRSRRSAA